METQSPKENHGNGTRHRKQKKAKLRNIEEVRTLITRVELELEGSGLDLSRFTETTERETLRKCM